MLIPLKQGARFKVFLWAEEDGTCEALEFLKALKVGGRRQQEDYVTLLRSRVANVAENGPIYNEEQSKELDDGIYEWKAPGGSRLLWFYDPTQKAVIVCTNGFRKPPSNKGYKPEIKKAKAMRERYEQERDEQSQQP